MDEGRGSQEEATLRVTSVPSSIDGLPRRRSQWHDPLPRSNDLVPLKEAARLLGLTVKTLYNRCVENAVEHYRYVPPDGERGRYSIPRREIERLQAEAIRPRIIDTGKTKPKKKR